MNIALPRTRTTLTVVLPGAAVATPRERLSESTDLDEDAALGKALKAVEREQYLQQVGLEMDIAMVGFCVNPFDPR
jgi:hypothetical protein